MKTIIEIPIRTLVTITLFALAIWALFLIRNVIILLFIAFILVSAISPLVTYLENYKIPRPFGIVIIYLILFLLLIGLFAAIVPLFIDQTVNLINNFPYYLKETSTLFGASSINSQEFFNNLANEFSSLSSNIFQITVSVFTTFISIVTIVVLTFYLLLDEAHLKKQLQESLPFEYRERVIRLLETVQQRLGAWVRGQLVLSLIIAVLYFIGLVVLHVDYPLALGLLGGVLEIIPVIGPIISAIPAVLVAFTQSPILALAVVGLYFVVQQLEGHVIVPNVMKRAIGLPSLLILISLLIGGRILGIIGIVLSVPVLVIIHVILFDIWQININKAQTKGKIQSSS